MNLRQILRKGANSYEFDYIHQTIYRYISLPVIWIFLKLKISANAVTVIGTLSSFIGHVLYLFFSPLAVLFNQFGYLCDYMDGAVARINKNCSEFGRWLDIMLDHLVRKFFHVALALGIYFFYRDVRILVIAFVLYAIMRLREIVAVMPQRQEKKEVCSMKRESVMSKYSIFSKVFVSIVDFNKVFFPFIILFNLNIIYAFYLFNIFVEVLRTAFDYYSVFCGIKEHSK